MFGKATQRLLINRNWSLSRAQVQASSKLRKYPPHSYGHMSFRYNSTNAAIENWRDYIREITEVTTDSLTPDIRLHLLTPRCSLWTGRPEDCKVQNPFWAFYWPGGQALSRYLLDKPDLVRGRRVLDVGSGCGASAIASAFCGASHVTANDICPVAAVAMAMNAELNHVHFDIATENLIGQKENPWDTILLGDMFYDTEFGMEVADWLEKLRMHGKNILIGDPERPTFLEHPLRKKLFKVAKFELPKQCREENNGLTHGSVWTFK